MFGCSVFAVLVAFALFAYGEILFSSRLVDAPSAVIVPHVHTCVFILVQDLES